MMGGTRFHDTCQTNAFLLTSCPTFRLSSLTFFFAVGLAWSSQCPRGGNCDAGVSPAVARAYCPRAGAGRSRDRGRDARATPIIASKT